MIKTMQKLIKDESGATAIEYGLIAALVSVAAVVAYTAVGTSLKATFTYISNQLTAAQPAA